MESKNAISIIGAGPVGLFMGILLAKRGYAVNIYEGYPREKVVEKLSARSYNITFFSRGINALKKAGLLESVKQYFIPLGGTVAHPLYAKATFHKYDTTKSQYVAVKRSSILESFLEVAAKYPQIKLYFDTSLLSINRQKKTMILQNNKTKQISNVPAPVVLGADGIHSEVRKAILEGQNVQFSMEYETWKYRQVNIDISMVEKLKMKKKIMHVWSRKDALLALLPNEDDSYSGMLTVPSFEQLNTPERLESFIVKQCPDLIPNTKQITSDILNNPDGRLLSIYIDPWYYKDSIALVGDAAHGTLPFLGQGITAGFEDCLALAKLIDTYGSDWEKIFPLYQELRKSHADVVVSLSQKMFGKFLRHTYADYDAIYDRVDMLLNRLFPRYWHPAFYMMLSSYSTVGFADILHMHTKQRKISRWLGISFAVASVTQILSVVGIISEYIKKSLELSTRNSD